MAHGAPSTPEVDFSPFQNEPTIVIAVSGGSDSTALMMLARESLGPDRLIVATVDHGLRPEAAAEAAATGLQCRALGMRHHTLHWHGAKPGHGVQAAARKARMSLLAGFAVESGARVVLTGHTADDQAETVLMRRARGDGIGLAGIAPATLFQRKVWFTRPLIGLRRSALRTFLRQRDTGWIDDPSNDNDAYERVRMRKRLASTNKDDFDKALQIAIATAAERTAVSVEAAGLIDAFVVTSDDMAIRVGRDMLGSGQPGLFHAFRLLIATVGGAPFLPDAERVREYVLAFAGGQSGSLGNCRGEVSGGDVILTRDLRGRQGPPPPLVSPFREILPSFDLAAAAAISRLLGEPVPAVTPWT